MNSIEMRKFETTTRELRAAVAGHRHDALRAAIANIPAGDRDAAIDAATARYDWQAGIIEGASFLLLLAVFVFWWVAS